MSQTGLLVKKQAVDMKRVTRVGRILLFIPVLFILLRVWAVVQYLYIVYLTQLTDPSGRCIPTDPHMTVHVVLGVLQVSLPFDLVTYPFLVLVFINLLGGGEFGLES